MVMNLAQHLIDVYALISHSCSRTERRHQYGDHQLYAVENQRFDSTKNKIFHAS